MRRTAEFKEDKLKDPIYSGLLWKIGESTDITATEISSWIRIDRSAVVKQLKRLEAEGYLISKKAPHKHNNAVGYGINWDNLIKAYVNYLKELGAESTRQIATKVSGGKLNRSQIAYLREYDRSIKGFSKLAPKLTKNKNLREAIIWGVKINSRLLHYSKKYEDWFSMRYFFEQFTLNAILNEPFKRIIKKDKVMAGYADYAKAVLSNPYIAITLMAE